MTPTPNTPAALDLRATIDAGRAATGQLRTNVDTFRRQHAEIQAEIDRIVAAPRDDADKLAAARAIVAAMGARFSQEEAPALVFGDAALASPDGVGGRGIDRRIVDSFDCLCACDPEAAVRHLMAIMALVPHTPGPPLAERPGIIARLEAERDAIGQAEEQLVDEAVALGIAMEHRPEVRARREQEARRLQLEQQERERQAEERRRLDEQHAGRRGQGPTASAYLNSQRNPYR